jgi:hypothetical protein
MKIEYDIPLDSELKDLSPDSRWFPFMYEVTLLDIIACISFSISKIIVELIIMLPYVHEPISDCV